MCDGHLSDHLLLALDHEAAENTDINKAMAVFTSFKITSFSTDVGSYLMDAIISGYLQLAAHKIYFKLFILLKFCLWRMMDSDWPTKTFTQGFTGVQLEWNTTSILIVPLFLLSIPIYYEWKGTKSTESKQKL